MARSLENKANVDPADSDYPYGRIRDKTASVNGTPVNEEVYGDFHQFFAKLFAESGLTYNEQPDNDYSGFQYFEALQTVINALIALGTSLKTNGVVETGNSVVLKTKVVEIGDWDMDTDSSVNVAHGVADPTKIRSVNVFIRHDTTATIYPLSRGDSPLAATPVLSGWVSQISGLSITLERTTGGFFDSTVFNATSYNRGWAHIEYES